MQGGGGGGGGCAVALVCGVCAGGGGGLLGLVAYQGDQWGFISVSASGAYEGNLDLVAVWLQNLFRIYFPFFSFFFKTNKKQKNLKYGVIQRESREQREVVCRK